MIAVWAVAQDATGKARDIALAYGRAIGCGRAGLIASSFAEEAEADLFNEQAVVWGAVPELLIAGFETLVDGGVSPELAYLECVGELKLIAELIEARGIAGMREAISNTAELGALLGGRRIVDEGVRERMAEVLAEVRAGRFAEELQARGSEGYPRLEQARSETAKRCSKRPIAGSAKPKADQPIVSLRQLRPLANARPLEIGALQLAVRFGDFGVWQRRRAPAPRPRGARNRCGPGWPWRASCSEAPLCSRLS